MTNVLRYEISAHSLTSWVSRGIWVKVSYCSLLLVVDEAHRQSFVTFEAQRRSIKHHFETTRTIDDERRRSPTISLFSNTNHMRISLSEQSYAARMRLPTWCTVRPILVGNSAFVQVKIVTESTASKTKPPPSYRIWW